jgi:tetratricopeptide (TPR) repeat protein
MKTNPNDVDALYYFGAAHGALGGYEATMAHAFMSALRHGSKSVDAHEKVLKLDPNYSDAYLTVGMYHYVVGSLPFVVKIAVALGGVTGSKRDGIAELERDAKAERRTADDARVILISLYVREDRLADSLGVLRELKAKYPANYVVGIEEANTLVSLARYDEAYAAYDRLLEMPRVNAEARDYVEYAYANALMKSNRFDRALEHFGQVWQWKSADPDLVTLARLGAGQCHDALKQRREALTEYQTVIRRPDVLDSRKKAEKYTKQAYVPSSPMASTGQL